jgi:hypothetical protein
LPYPQTLDSSARGTYFSLLVQNVSDEEKSFLNIETRIAAAAAVANSKDGGGDRMVRYFYFFTNIQNCPDTPFPRNKDVQMLN